MPHGALTRYERGRKKGKKALFHLAAGWWMNDRLAAFVTGSEVEKGELIADGIGRRVEYAGVGTALVSSPPEDRALADPIRLLTMSRLAAKKRVDVAVRAVRHLLDSGLRVSLTVAGAGDSETERSIKDVIQSLGLTDAVQMVGLVKGEAKERLLAESDIFLLPSEDENFGIGVAEAAMHGLFVVASSKVAAATMLSEESASKLDSTDPRSFATAVERAVGDHPVGARSQISTEARELFSWSAVAQRWVSILGDRSRD
jgi:glycosyltransferase involved in cell wall biosynthesis